MPSSNPPCRWRRGTGAGRNSPCSRLGKRILLGFRERRLHRIVDVEQCPALTPGLNRLIAPLKALAAQLPFETAMVTALPGGTDLVLEGKIRLDLAARQALADFAIAADIARITAAGEVVLERHAPSLWLGDVPVTPAPGGFLQPSQSGEAALVRAVLDRLGEGHRRAVDLFAGCGTFTLALAHLLPVAAFEGDQPAVQALERALRQARGLKPATVQRRDLYRRPVEAVEFNADDVVVIDPPARRGGGAVPYPGGLAGAAHRGGILQPGQFRPRCPHPGGGGFQPRPGAAG